MEASNATIEDKAERPKPYYTTDKKRLPRTKQEAYVTARIYSEGNEYFCAFTLFEGQGTQFTPNEEYKNVLRIDPPKDEQSLQFEDEIYVPQQADWILEERIKKATLEENKRKSLIDTLV